MQKAHQKALVAISTFEREIERLNCTRAHSRARSKSGTTIDQVRKGGRGDTAKSDLQTNLPQANLLTPRHHRVKRGLRAEALTWRNCWS